MDNYSGQKMKVLFFGAYNPNYARNSVLIEGLKLNGVEVIECRDDSPGLIKFWKLFFKHWKLRKEYDVFFVAFLGQILMPFATFLNWPLFSSRRRKPLVFDAFMSLYDSNVFGREKVRRGSCRAYFYWLLDWVSMHLGDIVLFDTEQHIKYIAEEFGVKKERMKRIFVGAQEDIFYPRPPRDRDGVYRVIFHGTFIKSQGIEYILEAARILKEYNDIEFIFIGEGQVFKEMKEIAAAIKLSNVKFLGFLSLEEIACWIADSDVCLGIFGKPAKIQRVIPNKVFECVAMQKPIITVESPAILELFSREDLVLTKIADAEDIAEAILKLKNDPVLAQKNAQNAYNKFKEFSSTKNLGSELKSIFIDLQRRDAI